jgi:hypothetical protein
MCRSALPEKEIHEHYVQDDAWQWDCSGIAEGSLGADFRRSLADRLVRQMRKPVTVKK